MAKRPGARQAEQQRGREARQARRAQLAQARIAAGCEEGVAQAAAAAHVERQRRRRARAEQRSRGRVAQVKQPRQAQARQRGRRLIGRALEQRREGVDAGVAERAAAAQAQSFERGEEGAPVRRRRKRVVAQPAVLRMQLAQVAQRTGLPPNLLPLRGNTRASRPRHPGRPIRAGLRAVHRRRLL